jgi:hypothetical protein
MRSAIRKENLITNGETVRSRDGVGMSPRPHDNGSIAWGGGPCPGPSGSIEWAISTLRHQGMPSEEIVAILGADDLELIRRYLELHRERLEEHLADQRRTLPRLERLLAARSIRASARWRKEEVAGR